MAVCRICGKPNCKKHTILLPRTKNITELQGASPPEIFVGRYNYPNINIGILSPQEYGDTSAMSSPEKWHKQKLKIPQILSLRNKLIYGRTKSHIKQSPHNLVHSSDKQSNKIKQTMQEVALTVKSIPTEFKLKKPIQTHKERETRVPLIANAAQVKSIKLQENPKIKHKIENITSDTDAKSVTGIKELSKHTSTSQIIKILSAGLLGRKTLRKLVPTRWSITAVDSTLSKQNLEKIRYFQEISEFQVFSAEYLGNHYEFLLLPDNWSFEVIEISYGNQEAWQDYESFFNRKTYASVVTGAYYANRLALSEHLLKIRRQASCLVFREILPSYTDPLGVGILREASRQAFKNPPSKHNSLQEAIQNIQTRIKQPITNYTNKSQLLKNYNKQSRLSKWF
jgi:DNA repair protein NreA